MQKWCIFLLVAVFLASLVSAQEYALDIKTDKQLYSVGENVTYTVLLLADGKPFSDNVQLTFSDAEGKMPFNRTVLSNVEQTFFVENSFISGFWSIDATYKDKKVKRIFSVGERQEVEFSITGDKLVIKNNGNVPYTKTVQIMIGDKLVTQKQDIRVGDFKEIKLIAPDGTYSIQVTDGVQTISKSNVVLTGTGNVIGALDEQLVSNSPALGGARDDSQGSFFFNRHFSVAFIFIGAIGGLALLVFMERFTRKKSRERAKAALQHAVDQAAYGYGYQPNNFQ